MKRRTDAVGMVPKVVAAVRLAGAIRLDPSAPWAARRLRQVGGPLTECLFENVPCGACSNRR